jgi:long-chain fatty acid transport protein
MMRSVARWTWVLWLLAPAAQAQIYDTYGFGPRAAAMGGAMTAEARDYSAVFYNPALLVERKDIDFGFSFQWNKMVSDVHSEREPELDCALCTPPDSVGYSLGLLFPLAGKVKNRVALGLGIYIPSQRLLRLLAPEPNAPFWYHYQSGFERIVIHVGAGIKITDWLTIGLGAQVLADLVPEQGGLGADVKVDLFNKTVKARSIDAHLATRVSPVLGLQVHPIERLRIGATYRGEISLLYQIPASVDLEGIGVLGFTIQGTTHYTPHTVAFGASWDITPELTVALDGEWQHWSAAPSPYMDISIDLSGDTLKALGLEDALDIKSLVQRPGFSDTVNTRLGVEYRLSDRFAARLGGFFKPTPVPKQSVPGTNILDCDAIGIAAGVGFNFPDPLEIFQSPIHIDVATQAQFLLPREAVKEPTDVVPSYTYSAKTFGLTAAIRYDF